VPEVAGPRRRPYRVVFSPALPVDPPGGDAARSSTKLGTIVAADLPTARREAHTIARDGGTADVVYVDPTGGRHVVATYTPDDPHGSAPVPT